MSCFTSSQLKKLSAETIAETSAEQQAVTAHPLKDAGQQRIAVTEASGRTAPVFPTSGLRTHVPSSGGVPCTSGLQAGAKSSRLQAKPVKDAR